MWIIQELLFTEPAKIAVKKADIMKKIIFKFGILCLVLFCFILSGCSADNKKENVGLNIVAVNFPCYDFARAICGDRADIKMIIRPGAEVHGYEPSLSDIVAIQEADIFIYGGGEGDIWVQKILSSIDKSDLKTVAIMDIPGLTLYKNETHSGFMADHDHHHSHHHSHTASGFDEHVWTSPKNAIKIVNYFLAVFEETDSKNKDFYRNNANEYIKKLHDVDKNLENTVAMSKHKFIAVADRFPFVYMANDYDINYIAAFSGCSPESDAGPKVIANIIEEINHHSIDRVFYIELSNQKMADAISEHTGAKKLLLHSCQNVTKDDFENGVTYVDLMNQNIINLKEALN